MSSLYHTTALIGKRKRDPEEEDDNDRPSKRARHTSCPREQAQHEWTTSSPSVNAADASKHETCASKRKHEEDCEPQVEKWPKGLARPLKRPRPGKKETEEKHVPANASTSQATPSTHVNSVTPPPSSSLIKRSRAVASQDDDVEDECPAQKRRLTTDAKSARHTSTIEHDTHKPSGEEEVDKEDSNVKGPSESASDSQHQRESASEDQKKSAVQEASDTTHASEHQSTTCSDATIAGPEDSEYSHRESSSGSSDSEATDHTTITVPDTPEPVQKPETTKLPETKPAASADNTSQSKTELEANLPNIPAYKATTGLLNCSNACYINAVLQLLDVAFSAAQIAKMRGTEELADFRKESAKVWKFNLLDAPRWERNKPYQMLKAKIESLPGSTRKSAFLGQLLIDLRTGLRKTAKREVEDFIPPFIFQHIFALCGLTAKPEFDGHTQQDAAEYLDNLLEMLVREGALNETAFAATVETTQTCTDAACMGSTIETTQPVHILVNAPQASSSFEQLLQEWLNGVEDASHKTCQKCETRGHLIEQHRTTALPDNVIVQINRYSYCHNKVSIPFDQILSLGVGEYEVAAVICREGDNPLSGHYKCFKKVDGAWYLCNDQEVEAVDDISKLSDGMRKYGRSTIVLLSKV